MDENMMNNEVEEQEQEQETNTVDTNEYSDDVETGAANDDTEETTDDDTDETNDDTEVDGDDDDDDTDGDDDDDDILAHRQMKTFSKPLNEEDVEFTLIDGQDVLDEYLGAYTPTMPTLDYVGDTEFLLRLIHAKETMLGCTVPIVACGIDVNVFKHIAYKEYVDGELIPSENSNMFVLTVKDEEGNEEDITYELVTVDGVAYMSRTESVINVDHLQHILREATVAIHNYGKYTLNITDYVQVFYNDESQLFKTMQLNNFEMSLLIAYMNRQEGMTHEFAVEGGRQCLKFCVKN